MPKESNPRRAFYQLLANTVLSGVTNMTVWFAVIFFVFLETRSVMVTSITNGLFFAATAISGFWFGSLVDRHRKKHMMLISSVASLAAYGIAFVLYLTAPEGAFQNRASVVLWSMVLLLTAGVIAGNIRGIAVPTIVTGLFPAQERDKANGLVGTASGIAILVVSAISGVLVGLAGLYLVFILALVLTGVTIAHLLTLPLPEPPRIQTDGPDDPPPAGIDIRGTFAIVLGIPGLLALILFTSFNNFLGGVFAGLIDAYGLSLVSVEMWGILFALVSVGFVMGGLGIARWGLGRNPLWTLLICDVILWAVSSLFMIHASIVLLVVGMLLYMCIVPFVEAAEHTVIQKIVPPDRQGRVFGFAQSVETSASPLTTLLIGPLAELVFIPFMTTGAGVDLIGNWFGTGAGRGIALVFTVTGLIGLAMTLLAMRSRYYHTLSDRYQAE
ncbi:MAG: MFS transporter [Anaerolineae bacterium]